MYSLKDDDCPEKGKAPDVTGVVEEFGLDEGVGSDEPVEGGEGRGCVVFWDGGSGVS